MAKGTALSNSNSTEISEPKLTLNYVDKRPMMFIYQEFEYSLHFGYFVHMDLMIRVIAGFENDFYPKHGVAL